MKKLVNKINTIENKNMEKYIFVFSMFICLFIGVLLSYNFDVTTNYNLLFDSDTARVISDATEIIGAHNRLDVHPLYMILIQPIALLLQGITINKMFSLIIISSLATSLTTVFIYKILSIYTKNNLLKVGVVLSYLLSFGNIIFTSQIEIYNIAVLFLVIMWYYFITKFDNKKNSIYVYYIMTILGVLSAAFTITNYCIFLILIGMMFLFKKINLKKSILIVLFSILIILGLNSIQKIVWHNPPFLIKSNIIHERGRFRNKNVSFISKVNNVVKNDFSNSIIANKSIIKVVAGTEFNGANYVLNFSKTNIIKIIFMLCFYSLMTIIVIRNYKKNLFINSSLLLALAFNFLLHLLYGNECTFLYSLHFVYLIYLLYGINLSKEENKTLKKISYIFLSILLIVQVIINSICFTGVLNNIGKVLNKTYFITNYGTIKTIIFELITIVIIISLSIIIKKLIDKYKDSKDKDKKLLFISLIVITCIGIECIFVMINVSQELNTFFTKNIEPKTEITVPESKISHVNTTFKDYYKKEIKSLNNYLDEYTQFKKKYSNTSINYLNEIDYYFFGMGNRRKMVYVNDSLIDLDTEEVIYSFEAEERMIIPNEYSVIIQTNKDDYIKIYEDSSGVHYNKNGKDSIIDGTKVKIDLYDFNNQEYKNIKKTLYGEILFNIKDSKIYPNILVYDSPWYRDAALAAMVLKQTKNSDLIKEWVDSITEIYDKQNGGIKEPDNLGELLYIISTQKDINYDLVNKIKEEADSIANNNPNGYYLYGKTDYQDEYLYQNLWYKLGLESLGMKFDYNIDGLSDNYSPSAWWSDYKINSSFQFTPSVEYPYLTTAYRHKLGYGSLVTNNALYPLSWEQAASSANYENMKVVNREFIYSRISPVHTWAASEMLLFILDETNDLNI